jgi:hypothetical protein
MRLTLRTLLAYLDEILEPADAEEIAGKIEESEFAGDLARRTRDVTRRLRLGAPPPLGTGMGDDPNTVAEYLDNTMPTERVADFERVCLESDTHLAEVSACHQVLTLVLGEPAEVPPRSRERMYRIGAEGGTRGAECVSENSTLHPPHSVLPSHSELPAPHSELPKRRPKPEVPEYLRQSRRGRWRGAAVFVAAVVLGGGAMALWTEPGLWNGGDAPQRGVGEGASGRGGNAELAPSPASAPPVVEVAEELDLSEASLAESEPAFPPEPTDPMTRPENTPEPTNKGTPLASSPPRPLSDSPTPDSPSPDSPRMASRPLEKPLKARRSEEPSEPTAEDRGVGHYVFDKNVLLRFDSQSGQWARLGQPVPLQAGDKLLSPPTFRNTIKLGGVTLQLVGGASVVLGEADDQGARRLELLYGRVVLSNEESAAATLRIKLGGEERKIVLPGGSKLAVELRRVPALGQDPQTASAPAVVDLYAPGGRVEWQSQGQMVAVESPAHWRPAEAPPANSAASMPEWIDALPLGVNDLRARVTLEAALTADLPPARSLAELTDNRRLEVRDLATRVSVSLGQFEPFVAALNDADQHARWDRHIETLRAAMARDGRLAERARGALAARRGEDGPALYRMLWGYTNAQLADGAAKQLVEYLDHESLDYRVLAFWNLRDIVGYGLNYRPEFPPTRRMQSVRRWQELLEKGEIARKETGN